MKKVSKAQSILLIAVIVILGIYFSLAGIVSAKGFLAPLTVAVLFSMVLIPVSRWLENHGFSRGWSSFSSTIMMLLLFMGLAYVIILQGEGIAKDWPQIKKRLQPKIEQVQHWVHAKTGVTLQQQEKFLQNNTFTSNNSSQENGRDGSKSLGATSSPILYFKKSVGLLGVVLLTFVYIFFILLYRSKLRLSLLQYFNKTQKPEADRALKESVKLAQSYLGGRLLLILFLIFIYSVGLAVSGVRHAILISIIASILTIIPYIGNIVGYGLALSMAIFDGGQITGALIGVTITFGLAQFVESYVLEPYVVGHRVGLNPLATIIAVVAGGAIWGVIGMIIIIPVVGIVKIICDQIPILHPVGYTLGEEDIPQEEFLKKWGQRIRNIF